MNRVALVTGAAQGIGAATAERLADDGVAVAVADVDTEQATALTEAAPGKMVSIHLDVTDRSSIEAGVREIESTLGPITDLVNNAGIQRIGASESMDPARWAEVVAVNLTGVFACCQVVGSRMLDAGGGAIVNLASSNSERGMPGRTPYCATKTGVVGLTRALATEWAARGVRVNAVEPGYIGTPMVANAIEMGLIDEDVLLDRIPARRVGAPSEIASAIAFLLSEDASYITGTTLAVDGGFLAYGAPAPTSADQTRTLDP